MFDISRRSMLKQTSCGFGYMAFAGLAAQARAGEYANPLGPKSPHFAPRAKRVIFLCMRGGPSHVDTFDYKPGLAKHEGEAPGSVGAGLNQQKGRKLRVRNRCRRGSLSYSRYARDHPPLAWPGSHSTDLSIRRTRFPSDRRLRQRGEEDYQLSPRR
jgi:hypothetical protein